MSIRTRIAALAAGAVLCFAVAPLSGCGGSTKTEEPEKIQKFVQSEHSDPNALNDGDEQVDLPQNEAEGPGDGEGGEE